MTRKLLIAGGSGMIGTAITREAKAIGWDVTLLSRTPGPGRIEWDPSKGTISLEAPMTFDAIINLAGTSIAGGRWTDRRKEEIRSSRILSSRTIETHLSDGNLHTSVYIGFSGVSIYGDRGNELLDDTSDIPSSGDWLIETTKLWEESHQRIESMGIRTVILRTGIVLSPDGGALKELLKTAPFGLTAIFGPGRQYWPWIHIRDVVDIILESVRRTDMGGIYLTCAPNPVSVKTFSRIVARQMKPGRWVVKVPVVILRIMLGEMHRVLMDSCRAYPARLLSSGFQFRYPALDMAVKDLLQR